MLAQTWAFPIPSLDDPKDIGFGFLYFIALFGMFAAIYAVLVWVLVLPLTLKHNLIAKKNVLLKLIGLILMLIQLLADPFNLIYWLLD